MFRHCPVVHHEQRFGAGASRRLNGSGKVRRVSDREPEKMKAELRTSPLRLRYHQERAWIVRLVDGGDPSDARQGLVKHLEPLGTQLVGHETQSRDVATRASKARNEPLG